MPGVYEAWPYPSSPQNLTVGECILERECGLVVQGREEKCSSASDEIIWEECSHHRQLGYSR